MKRQLLHRLWALVLAAMLVFLCGCSANQDPQQPARENEDSDNLSDESNDHTTSEEPSDAAGQEPSPPDDSSDGEDSDSSGSESGGSDDNQDSSDNSDNQQDEQDTSAGTGGDENTGDTSGSDDAQGSGNSDGSLAVSSKEEIKSLLISAMEDLQQPQSMEISNAGLTSPEIDVLNIYYEITADRPELKVAYKLSAELTGSTLTCTFSYMPYATGIFPDGFDGIEVQTVHELIAVANDHVMDGNPVNIKITNKDLEPDQMSVALRQVGGGWLLCSLNSDATALTYSPPNGFTVEECISALAETQSLADDLIPQLITDNMTTMERAQAIYAYITANVEYDQLYYSDFSSMPYASQTALGALRDGTAICGGYSNALKLLFEMAGIECYNVTGSYFSENHMWNIANIDGQWLWFDATSDRGMSPEYGFLRFALTDLDTVKYTWDPKSVELLTGQSIE